MDKIEMIKKLEDFKKVITVFQEPPFSEPLTEEEMEEEFHSYQTSGFAYGYYSSNDILGYIGILKGIQQGHPTLNIDGGKILYINGVATLAAARKRGVGTKLMVHTLESVASTYDAIYLRTNAVGSKIENIAYSLGYKDLKEDGKLVTQEVTFERFNGTIETDQRKFMIKLLKKGGGY